MEKAWLEQNAEIHSDKFEDQDIPLVNWPACFDIYLFSAPTYYSIQRSYVIQNFLIDINKSYDGTNNLLIALGRSLYMIPKWEWKINELIKQLTFKALMPLSVCDTLFQDRFINV